jgi:hypothetical protein
MAEHTSPTPARGGPKARRSPLMVALGVVLVVAGALTAVGLYTNLSPSREVIVIAAPVARGERIEREDLVTAQVGYDPLLTPVLATELNQVVGQYALSDLVPGTFLAAEAIGAQTNPMSGQAEIGVALMAGEYPDDGLRPGDTVVLVALPEGTEAVGNPHTFDGTLIKIGPPSASGTIVVAVLVNEADAAELAVLSASDRLALILAVRGR